MIQPDANWRRSVSGTAFGYSEFQAADGTVLPSGFLTLLMSDIEGSTTLLHRLGNRYHALLKDVRDIQRRTTLEGGGHVVEVRADEFFAVFESAIRAVESAVAIQRILREWVWFDETGVRLRIGIHSGVVLGDVEYFGLDVHTTARICSLAHGGQIVISDETRAAAVAHGKPGLRFRGLGPHRLAGLAEEALFQVEADGLEGSFPPLRTNSARIVTFDHWRRGSPAG